MGFTVSLYGSLVLVVVCCEISSPGGGMLCGLWSWWYVVFSSPGGTDDDVVCIGNLIPGAVSWDSSVCIVGLQEYYHHRVCFETTGPLT